jgi:hypothetical protein
VTLALQMFLGALAALFLFLSCCLGALAALDGAEGTIRCVLIALGTVSAFIALVLIVAAGDLR